jgi:hypothetical protein
MCPARRASIAVVFVALYFQAFSKAGKKGPRAGPLAPLAIDVAPAVKFHALPPGEPEQAIISAAWPDPSILPAKRHTVSLTGTTRMEEGFSPLLAPQLAMLNSQHES